MDSELMFSFINIWITIIRFKKNENNKIIINGKIIAILTAQVFHFKVKKKIKKDIVVKSKDKRLTWVK